MGVNRSCARMDLGILHVAVIDAGNGGLVVAGCAGLALHRVSISDVRNVALGVAFLVAGVDRHGVSVSKPTISFSDARSRLREEWSDVALISSRRSSRQFKLHFPALSGHTAITILTGRGWAMPIRRRICNG